jgi:hypothetical protein
MDPNPLTMVRALCLALPEATERTSHGEPSWFVRKSPQFAMFSDHHHDDRVGFVAAAPAGAQQAWVAKDSTRFYVPPYFGGRGWIGIYLDVPQDWEDIADIVEDAYRTVAPKTLLTQLDAERQPE